MKTKKFVMKTSFGKEILNSHKHQINIMAVLFLNDVFQQLVCNNNFKMVLLTNLLTVVYLINMRPKTAVGNGTGHLRQRIPKVN